jgi:hypothetical protein
MKGVGFLKACRAAVKDAEGCIAPDANDERTRLWPVLTPRAANRSLPKLHRRQKERASGLCLRRSLCQAHAHSLTHLCATFASAIIITTTTSTSCIPLYHREPPDIHRAWLSKSRYLPVPATRAHPRASDKGETEGASGGAGSTCRKKDKKKKDEDETGAGKQ